MSKKLMILAILASLGSSAYVTACPPSVHKSNLKDAQRTVSSPYSSATALKEAEEKVDHIAEDAKDPNFVARARNLKRAIINHPNYPNNQKNGYYQPYNTYYRN